MSPKKKILLRVSLAVASLFLLYILSYPVVLPLLEKVELGLCGYVFYEPVEMLRDKSSIFWRATEAGYEFFGGKVLSRDRAYFTTTRRCMHWNDEGVLVIDSFWKNNMMLSQKTWYGNGNLATKDNRKRYLEWFENGKPKREADCHDNGIWKKYTEWNDKGVVIAAYEFSEDGKGKMAFYDDSGKEVAQCACNQFVTPFEGTFLTPKMENGKRYILQYKEGKEVGKTIYSQGKQPEASQAVPQLAPGK